jgi:hypothetical protein
VSGDGVRRPPHVGRPVARRQRAGQT